MTVPADMNLDELRAALAPRLPAHAGFDGWTERALATAAAELGVPADRARLAFKGGAAQMIDAWFDSIDRAMLAAFPPERIAAMKIRERIRALLLFRFEATAPHREALRRALAVLALPRNAPEAARLAWRAADRIWRAAGDECGRLQPLYQADHADRRLWLDHPRLPRRRQRRLCRHRGVPRPPHRRRDALREGEGALDRLRPPLLAFPLPRPAPLPGRLRRPSAGLRQ